MGKLNLQQLSEMMRDIDFVMLQTRTENGQIAGRPMSNNKDVEYDGSSFYFPHAGHPHFQRCPEPS
jgi:general stress protein 26